jgi:alpha-L-fucosidase
MLIIHEAFSCRRPWVITNENNIWFTRARDTVYVFLTKENPWKLGEPKTFTLRSIRSTPQTKITVLGQSGEIVEYRPEVNPKTTWNQDAAGLHITAYRAQRLYTDRRWPNPIVLKITNAAPGLTPPEVSTGEAQWNPATRTATLHGRLAGMGNVRTPSPGPICQASNPPLQATSAPASATH